MGVGAGVEVGARAGVGMGCCGRGGCVGVRVWLGAWVWLGVYVCVSLCLSLCLRVCVWDTLLTRSFIVPFHSRGAVDILEANAQGSFKFVVIWIGDVQST